MFNAGMNKAKLKMHGTGAVFETETNGKCVRDT